MEQCQGFDGPCNNEGERYRQNTYYPNEDDNWRTLCPQCRQWNDEYWEERWEEYWAGVLPIYTYGLARDSSDNPKTYPRNFGE